MNFEKLIKTPFLKKISNVAYKKTLSQFISVDFTSLIILRHF